MKIEVYSVKNLVGAALKSKLESALAHHHLNYEVGEKTHVEDFIQAGLNSVPAVKIGDTIIEHKEDMTYDETVQKALNLIMYGEERFILVPVDFSIESKHALRYAHLMASHLGASISIVHVHEPIVDPVTNTAYDSELLQQNREQLEKLLINLGWDKYHEKNHVPIQIHLKKGDLTSTLVKMLEEEKYEMIIMSTSAENAFMKKMIGSKGTHISKFISKPLIIVPPETHLKFPSRLVVGMTDEIVQGPSLKYILGFAISNKLIVDFVYATNDVQHFEDLKTKLFHLLVNFEPKLAGLTICSIPYEEKRINESLEKYAIEHHAGMMVLLTHHRTFPERLFHSSVTNQTMIHSTMPVMILHELE